MQQKVSLYVETSTKEKLRFQVYLTDDNKVMLTSFNNQLHSVAAVIDENIPWELIAQDLIDYALTIDTPQYIHDRLKGLGLNDEQLEWLGFQEEENDNE